MMTTTEDVLKTGHYLFACEAINGLNRLYGIPIELPKHSADDYFFNNDIQWGIATICYLFRKDFFKIFSKLKGSLKNEKLFKKYCMLISVSKNDRYFFNFLRRVALIYEIAVYCYRNGSDYFVQARSCISRYQDKVYFHSAGSWPRLTKTASFLRELGNPFLLVILQESSFRYPLRFSATVERIEKRLKKKDYMGILFSKEMCFLMQQKEKFATRTQDEKKRADSQTEREVAFSQCLKSISCMTNMDTPDEPDDHEVSTMKEREAIIEYLGSLLLSEVSNKFRKKEISSEPTCCNAIDPFKPFDKHCQSHPDSDDQKEKKGSSMNDEIPLDNKCLSLRLSDKSKNEKTETSKPKPNEGELFSEGSSSSDEDEQLDYTLNDECLPSKPMIYSSMESLTSGSLIFSNYIDSSGNECSSLELRKNESLSECSPEAENAQHNKNENKYLNKWEQHSSSSNSGTETSTSEFENTPSDRDFLRKFFEEDLDNRTRLLSIDPYIPENVPVKQSTISDEKQGNENLTDDKNVAHRKLMINLNSLSEAFNEAPHRIRISMNIPSETKTTVDASETVADTPGINSSTNVNNSLSNPQSRQVSRKKSRRKKKGKRK